MRLYLVRHPQPEIEPDTCYGSADIDVAAAQREQVCAALLASLPKDAVLYSSPLRRCADLARQLASGFDNCEVIIDARLVEMDFGDWELRLWSDIPRAEIDAWTEDVVAYRPGGGESVLEMAKRVLAFRKDLLSGAHQSAVVICHAGTIRVLLACQRQLPLMEMARYAALDQRKFGYGEVLAIDL